MKTTFLILAGLCFLGFLFSISPWLGMGGLFLSIAYYLSIRKPSQKKEIVPKYGPDEFSDPPKKVTPTSEQLDHLGYPIRDESIGSEQQAQNKTVPDSSNPYGLKLGKVGSFVIFILISSVFRAGYREWKKSSIDAEVSASRYKDWPQDYREKFENNCVLSAKKSISEDYTNARGDMKVINSLDRYTQEYCTCMRVVVESKHMIPTMFNPSRRSIAQAETESERILAEYIKSEDGERQTTICASEALKEAKKP